MKFNLKYLYSMSLKTAKKLVEILEDLNKIDKNIEKKFKKNNDELIYYKELKNNTNKYFSSIQENFKNVL